MVTGSAGRPDGAEVVGMKNAGALARENEALRQRLSRLSESNLRINESLR